MFFNCQGEHLSALDIGSELFEQAAVVHDPGDEPHISNMGWLRRCNEDFIVLGFGQTGVCLIKRSDAALSKGAMNIHQPFSFGHGDVIKESSTILWTQDHRASGGFIRLPYHPLDPSFTIVEDVQVNADASYIATKLSRLRQVIWIWCTSFNNNQDVWRPKWVIHFDHHVTQMLFHPVDPHWLVVVTSDPLTTIYVWRDTDQKPAILPVDLPDGEETGEIVVAWLEPLVEEGDFPLMIASPDAFDIGIMKFPYHDEPSYWSVLGLATPLSVPNPIPVDPSLARLPRAQASGGAKLKRKREGED